MAFSISRVPGNGTSNYAINFVLGFNSRDEVRCQVNGEVDGLGDPSYRTLTWINDGLVTVAGGPFTGSDELVFTRTVDKTQLVHDYSDGEPITEKNLDESNKQTLMSVHEFLDGRLDSPLQNDLDMGGFRIINMGAAVDPDDAVTLEQTETVIENLPAINTVADNITSVNTVSAAITAVNTVSTNIANVNTVATNIANVNTVAGISTQVTTVAGISGNVTTVAGIAANVTTVAGNTTNINTVATNNANVTAVGTNIANVNAVAGNATNINAVNANATNINTVAGINAAVSTVAGISSAVSTVAGNTTNINTVSGISANVTTVAGISGNVTTVAGISANVTSVATNATNINTVATNIANVNTVGAGIANVNTVAGAITNINTVATNIAAVNSVASLMNTGWYKNVITNGAFQIQQRGTSFAITNNAANYTADRWAVQQAAGTVAITAAIQSAPATGVKNSLRVQRNSGNTNVNGIILMQVVENQDMQRLQGKSVTLSFYAKAGANFSAASSLLGVTLRSGTAADEGTAGLVGNSWTGVTSPIATTQAITTTRTKYTFTATIPSGSNEIGLALFYTPVGTASTNDWFEIDSVQIEPGSQATAFEYRPYGVEMTMCRRFYEQGYVSYHGDVSNTGQYGGTVNFACTKRVAPTISYSAATVHVGGTSFDTTSPTTGGRFATTINSFYFSKLCNASSGDRGYNAQFFATADL